MEKYEIIMSNQAEKQLNEIINYISNILINPSAAKKLLNEFIKIIYDLEIFPEKFPKIDDSYIPRKNIRKCIVNNYVVIYIVDKNKKQVQISHFFYAKKDWMKLI